jgi:hypothetical protein
MTEAPDMPSTLLAGLLTAGPVTARRGQAEADLPALSYRWKRLS